MKDKLSIVVIIAVVIVFIVWLFFPDYILSKFQENIEKAGAYGDIFGAVNALFTSLAFALLIYTALLQREELKLQRQELAETRKELAKSAMMQEKLVEITQAGFDLQRHLRKNDLWPEFSISKSTIALSMGIRGPAKKVTEITLIPKYSALRLTRARITTNGNARLNEDAFNEQKGKIINEGEPTTIQVFHERQEDLSTINVYLGLSDVDEENHYIQRIGFSSDKVFITRSFEEEYPPGTIFGGAT